MFRAVCGFLQFSLWFSVFVNNDGGFRILLPISFYGFSGFAKDATPRSHAKTVIPRNHLQQETMRLTVRGMQARIHTGFHRFTELGQNFHNNKKIDMYTFVIKVN